MNVKFQVSEEEFERQNPPIKLKLNSKERILLKTFLLNLDDKANFNIETNDYKGVFFYGLCPQMYKVLQNLRKKL